MSDQALDGFWSWAKKKAKATFSKKAPAKKSVVKVLNVNLLPSDTAESAVRRAMKAQNVQLTKDEFAQNVKNTQKAIDFIKGKSNASSLTNANGKNQTFITLSSGKKVEIFPNASESDAQVVDRSLAKRNVKVSSAERQELIQSVRLMRSSLMGFGDTNAIENSAPEQSTVSKLGAAALGLMAIGSVGYLIHKDKQK
jgi:hypothetical protein